MAGVWRKKLYPPSGPRRPSVARKCSLLFTTSSSIDPRRTTQRLRYGAVEDSLSSYLYYMAVTVWVSLIYPVSKLHAYSCLQPFPLERRSSEVTMVSLLNLPIVYGDTSPRCSATSGAVINVFMAILIGSLSLVLVNIEIQGKYSYVPCLGPQSTLT